MYFVLGCNTCAQNIAKTFLKHSFVFICRQPRDGGRPGHTGRANGGVLSRNDDKSRNRTNRDDHGLRRRRLVQFRSKAGDVLYGRRQPALPGADEGGPDVEFAVADAHSGGHHVGDDGKRRLRDEADLQRRALGIHRFRKGITLHSIIRKYYSIV